MLTSTWDADLMFSYESSSDAATTVVSDDIWKKFDLDAPLDNYAKRYKNDLLDDGPSQASALPSHVAEASSSPSSGSSPPSGMMMMMHFDKLNCRASREIRHHDCMWAGLCISKEHNRTLPARRDPQLYQRIPAGHSILIAKSSQAQAQQSQQPQQYSLLKSCQQQQQQQSSLAPTTTYSKGLESDGYSTRSQTPGSCSDDETEESEDEAPVFRHEQIDVHEQLNSIRVSMPVSEVTGQSIRRPQQPMLDRRKTPAEERAQAQQDIFEDHCYYSPINKKMVDQLGAPTPSDSEEEIDVVSYEKPPATPTPRPDTATSLPFCPSPNSQNRFQSTVNSAFRGRRTQQQIHQQQQQIQQQQRQHQQHQRQQQQHKQHARQSKDTSITRTPTTPRPRGRPPNSRKRALAAALEQQKLQQQQQQLLRQQQQQHQMKQEIKQEVKQEIKEEILSDFEEEPEQEEAAPTQAPPAKRSRNSGRAGAAGRKKPASNQGSPTKQRQSSDSDSDSEKRNLHNNMERQRRIELRIAFDEVRMMCPEIEYKDKAPKVAILKNASAQVLKLKAYDEECERQKAALRDEQRRLRARLSALRRSLSSMYR